MIDREMGETQRRCVEKVKFAHRLNNNKFVVDYCTFVIISELNDNWLTKFL